MQSSQKLTILTYHRVGEDEDFVSRSMGRGVSIPDFARQMDFLHRHCRVHTLSEALWLAKETEANSITTKPLVVVTFDDGYRDNHTHAWPILKKSKIPATIFLVACHVGGERLIWQHRLYYLKDTMGAKWVLKTLQRSGDFSGAMRWFRAQGDLAARNGLIDKLWKDAGCDTNLERKLAQNLYLDWEQVREMSARGMEFGSHSCTHPLLASVRGETLAEEIGASKAILEQGLGRGIETFAYPYGDGQSINADVVNAVRKAGYRGACTTLWGVNTLNGSDESYLLKRKGMNYSRPLSMWLEISGLKDMFRKWAGR